MLRVAVLVIVAMLLAQVAAGAAGPSGSLPPDRSVVLDLKWLAPPTIAPDSAWGSAATTSDFVRLSSRASPYPVSFTWSLRYAIPAEQYPVAVMRYRASSIGLTEQPVVQVEVTKGSSLLSAPVMMAADVIQDGGIHEFRKSLRPVPEGSAFLRLRFTLPPGSARLDLMEVRFDCESDSPTPSVPAAQSVDVMVVDAGNRPIGDAEVRAGPLERGNWSATTRTSSYGTASLTVTPPPVGGDASSGALTQPISLMVTRTGYEPYLVSSLQLPQSGPVVVHMVRPSAAPTDEGPPQQATNQSEPPVYPSYDNGGYPAYWGGAYGLYGTYPGAVYVIVVNSDKRQRNDSDEGRRDSQHAKQAKPSDQGIPGFIPVPVVVFSPKRPANATPGAGLDPVPSIGVKPVPNNGVIPVPGTISAPVPGSGFTPVPGRGFTPVPERGFGSSPGNGFTPVPESGFVSSKPVVFGRPQPVDGGAVLGGLPVVSSGQERPVARRGSGNSVTETAPRGHAPSGQGVAGSPHVMTPGGVHASPPSHSMPSPSTPSPSSSSGMVSGTPVVR